VGKLPKKTRGHTGHGGSLGKGKGGGFTRGGTGRKARGPEKRKGKKKKRERRAPERGEEMSLRKKAEVETKFFWGHGKKTESKVVQKHLGDQKLERTLELVKRKGGNLGLRREDKKGLPGGIDPPLQEGGGFRRNPWPGRRDTKKRRDDVKARRKKTTGGARE